MLFFALTLAFLAGTKAQGPSLSTIGTGYNRTVVGTATLTVVPWVETETFEIAAGSTISTTVLTGGQTETVTYSVFPNLSGNNFNVHAIEQTTGRCSGQGRLGPTSGDQVYTALATYRSQTTLTEGQVLTWHPYLRGEMDVDGSIDEIILNGPTVAEIVTTTPFWDYYYPYAGRAGYRPFVPIDDGSCYSACGGCQFFYPSVNVAYWPVSNANTACLGNSGSAAPTGTQDTAQKIKFRTLGLRDGFNETTNAMPAPTEVVTNGITYISPSIYVEFPTFLAWDRCGNLGPEMTSMVRSYAPEEISTMVFDSTFASHFFPFDFVNAECPPESVANNQFWMALAADGRHYNPIISAPKDLTDIEPYWKSCFPGPFQGHDPPIALTPFQNLAPNPTPQARPMPDVPSPEATTEALPEETALQPMPAPIVQTPDSPATTSEPSEAPTLVPSQSPQNSIVQDEQPEPAVPQTGSTEPLAHVGQPEGDSQPQPNSDDDSSNDSADSGSVNSEPPHHFVPTSSDSNPNGNLAQDQPQQRPNTPTTLQIKPPLGETAQGTVTPIYIDPASEHPSLTFFGTIMHVVPSQPLIIGTQTVMPGSSIMVSGTPLIFAHAPASRAANPGVDHVEILTPVLPSMTIGDVIVAPNEDSSFVVGSQTFAPGAIVSVSGSAFTLPTLAPTFDIGQQTAAEPLEVVVAGSAVTADSNTAFVVGSQTFQAGETVTFEDSVVTFPSPLTAAPTAGGELPSLTFEGSVISADSANHYVVGDETFSAGGVATIGDSTITFPTVSGPAVSTLGTLRTLGIGDLVASGIGGIASPTGSGAGDEDVGEGRGEEEIVTTSSSAMKLGCLVTLWRWTSIQYVLLLFGV